jgi:hypothetical protein
VVEWSRALDVRLSEWCCSVSVVWVQIPSREEQNLTTLKSNSNTAWFNFQTIYIYIPKAKYLKHLEIKNTKGPKQENKKSAKVTYA